MENKIATIGIFAHANAGKTTITEHLLYHTGVIKDIGRVDSGSTVTDNLSIEKERGISVRDTLVSFELDGKKIQLIDTPGHIDFSSEVERAISVLDAAILVISGVDGLEAQTFTIWRALKEKNIPIIIFINKMDRLGANYKKVIEELHEFLNVPTLTLTQVSQDDKGTLIVNNTSEIERMEEVALIDDEMLEMYVNQEKFNEKKLYEKIAELIKSGKLFPIIGGSALIDIGINDLIYCLNNFIPYTTRDKELPLSGFVYAIRIEENEKNAYIKILDTDEGSRFIGEFAIGTNPNITRPVGNIIYDEKMLGSFHIALGHTHPESDNKNRSAIHWDIVYRMEPEHGNAKMYFDDELIMDGGVFIPKKLQLLNKKQ